MNSNDLNLTREDYEIIGRKLKKQNPGKWKSNTDLQVGVVQVKKGNINPLDYLDYIPVDSVEVLAPSDRDIVLPPRPVPPPARTAGDHSRELVEAHNPRGGWWLTRLFQESRTEISRLLADQGEHLLRLQQAANATEAEAYLRNHNLWTLEIQAILRAEQAKGDIGRVRIIRTLELNAAKGGYTLESDQTLKVKREDKKIDWKDHKRRERLAKKLAQEEYEEKSKAVREVANAQEKVRELRVAKLEALTLEYFELEAKEMAAKPKAALLAIKQREIDRANKELYGLGPDTKEAGKTTSRNNDGSGGAGSQSGDDTSPDVGPVDKSNPSANPRYVQ